MLKYHLVVNGRERIVEIDNNDNIEETIKDTILSMVDYSWHLIEEKPRKKCKYHCEYGDGEDCYYKGKDDCIFNKRN